MLKHLQFEVEFPNGIKINRDISFQGGSTAISGKNGTGKSLILEMICFALFGIEAARGSSDDYRKCAVNLVLTIRGVLYKVTRSGSNAILSVEDESDVAKIWKPICTGTRPVNTKVVEVLGYAYNVFSVANLIGQGQIEALANMKPTERKKLIDRTIGLDSIETVIKWASELASLARKEADTLASVVVEPEVPTEPDGYVHSDHIKLTVENLMSLRTERDQLTGWLKTEQVRPELPVCLVTEPAEVLKVRLDHYQQVVARLSEAKRAFEQIPEAEYTLEQLEDMGFALDIKARWNQYRRDVGQMPAKPLLTQEQIRIGRWDHAKHAAWLKVREHKTTCPNCNHVFHPGGVEEVGEPEFTLPELDAQEAAHRAWENPPSEPLHPEPEGDLSYTAAALAKWTRAAERAAERALLAEEIQTTLVPEDPSADYHARVKYEADLASYTIRKDRYDAWVLEREAKQNRLGELSNLDSNLFEAQSRYADATNYERALRRYDDLKKTFDEQKARIEKATFRAAELTKSCAALKDLKSKIKTFLVPSLNRVASHLIQQMTTGQHQELSRVEVTEDFEISIDGQAIDTLNGSGKTVANLAVRIALGQILTNRVFSVLMADEVDAACDDERAEAIAMCLRGLTPNVAQVISVSHKGIQADHYVVL